MFNIPTNVTETARMHAPEIALANGIVSVVAAVVSAIVATRKHAKIEAQHKARVSDIYASAEDAKSLKKELRKETAKYAAKTALCYTPTTLFTGMAVASFAFDHMTLKTQRNAAMLAYTSVLAEYNALKEKYIQEHDDGYETIRQIEEEEKPEIATGKFYFGEGFSSDWRPNADYNVQFLKVKEGEMNVILQARGHLFVNDVLDELGMPKVPYGQLAGWIYDKKNPNGDNIISFGIFEETDDPDILAFQRHETTDVVITLNYDGDIVTGKRTFEETQIPWRTEGE